MALNLQYDCTMKTLLVAVVLSTLPAFAQSASSSANPLSGGAKYLYEHSKSDVLKSAQEMPEANYSFKPVDSVRSFGQLVAHVADAQYEFCAPVVGDGKQSPGIEKNKTSKADIIQALQDAFAYCDQAYNAMTDAHTADLVDFFGHKSPKLTILDFNTVHNMEHYGNMITYLRIKGLVPPSSQKQSME